ncbi:hypothetical protein HMP0721_1538 [Pseudoramibacter alactolyticus ATCC 23263]|uniref:Uncharacterized protein n=1 Tax=Pseudoramibacter alactolyticus ATCC 23263 TaxID=887929 RepID=E6MHQ3_9FIRM|nr:hypothetical protein HMP0721_1538 [Pseudoramibacter alactolyticus ATCC 23263]
MRKESKAGGGIISGRFGRAATDVVSLSHKNEAEPAERKSPPL